MAFPFGPPRHQCVARRHAPLVSLKPTHRRHWDEGSWDLLSLSFCLLLRSRWQLRSTARCEQGEGEQPSLWSHAGTYGAELRSGILHLLYEEFNTAITQQVIARNRSVIGVLRLQSIISTYYGLMYVKPRVSAVM